MSSRSPEKHVFGRELVEKNSQQIRADACKQARGRCKYFFLLSLESSIETALYMYEYNVDRIIILFFIKKC